MLNSNAQRFWMLSQLTDWLPAWRARSVYLAGQGLVDSNGNVQVVAPFASGTSGVSGAAQPVWSTATGATTPDAGVNWVNQGADTTQVQLSYCNASQRLQLRSMRTGSPPVESFTAATTLLQTVPMTVDSYGNYARWDSPAGLVVAGGSGPSNALPPDEVPIYFPAQPTVTDLAMGYDGVLYIALGGALVLVDRRNRWPNFTLTLPGFNCWRLLALPEGGVLVLDPTTPQLGKVAGLPLQVGPLDTPDPGILQPCQTNPNPPRLVARYALPAGEQYVALTPLDPTQQQGSLALLSWGSNTATNQSVFVRLFNELTPAGARLQLAGVRFPYAIAGLGAQKLAVLATNLSEALVYDLSNSGNSLLPTGETYLLLANTAAAPNAGPMVHGFELPPAYMHPVLAANPAATPAPNRLPLIPLSLNSMAATGATNPAAPAIVDSGIFQNAWHRLYLEAVMPPRTGAILWLAASDSLADFYNPAAPVIWYPHLVGAADTASIPTAVLADAPSAVWQSLATEVPFAPTLLGSDPVDAPIAGRQGLFMVLVQRAYTAVRTLAGRFLGVRIQLNGDGRNTPEIAGMRIYGPRFSYVQNYLPPIYREDKFGPDADAVGPSTHRDFFERFVDLFEAQFTRIEDRIANAYLLTRAESTPDQALPWLGGWLGVHFDHYPPDKRRARLKATPRLYRMRGTAKGVSAALDVATGGMCRRGAIIVIEDYRLRHIFATILGADLSVKANPLLPGYWGSSNSIVGDTLFLGDPGVQAELQALYQNDLDLAGGAQAAQAFYDQLAFRMTVFVHAQVENVNMNLVQRIVAAEKPAHVQAFVRSAKAPLMIGLASLIGVNTYLAPVPPANPATLGVSDVGRYDVIRNLPSLDPRMENASAYEAYAKPIPRIHAPATATPGATIVLDGSASTAPTGASIVTYQWTRLSVGP